MSWRGPKAEAEAAAGETTRKESTQIMIVIIFTHYLHTFLVLFTLGYNNSNKSRSNSIHSICNISQRLCAPRHVSCLSRSFAARSRPSRPGGHDLVFLQFQRLLSAVSSYIHCCWLTEVGVWQEGEVGSHLLTPAQFCHASLLSISTLSIDNDNDNVFLSALLARTLICVGKLS